MPRPVLIAGAGIAGLTAALAVARRGREVVLIERADALGEVGAGLQLGPNAVHALATLGLDAAVIARAEQPATVRSVSAASGAVLARLPLGEAIRSRFGAPYLVLPRPALVEVLAEAVAAEPRIALRTATPLLALEDRGDHVVATTGHGTVEAAAVLGADGLRSAVRTGHLGGPPARAAGKTAYRATIDGAGLPADVLAETFLWLARDAHLVHYPIAGGTRLNLVAVVEEAPADGGEIDWNAAGSAAVVARAFGGFAEPARALVAAATDWRRWPLYAVDPAGTWARGRVAILGDAAHAMLPFVAQGAAMAIEDAVVLAAALAEAATVEDALRDYAARRRPRVARVVAEAARTGRIYHLAGPAAVARDLAMRLAGGDRLIARLDWLYGWTPPR